MYRVRAVIQNGIDQDVPQRTAAVLSEVIPPSATTPKAIRHSELDARAVLALVQAAFWQLASCNETIMIIETVAITKLVDITGNVE